MSSREPFSDAAVQSAGACSDGVPGALLDADDGVASVVGAAELALGLAVLVLLALVSLVLAEEGTSPELSGPHAASEPPSPSVTARASAVLHVVRWLGGRRALLVRCAEVMPPLFRSWIPESTSPAAEARWYE